MFRRISIGVAVLLLAGIAYNWSTLRSVWRVMHPKLEYETDRKSVV